MYSTNFSNNDQYLNLCSLALCLAEPAFARRQTRRKPELLLGTSIPAII
jgi:hypothetical protein